MTYRRYRTMPPWRRVAAFLALLVVAVAAAAGARADEPGWMIGAGGPPRISNGVSIGGALVGGMTEEQAVVAVQASFRQPLPLGIRAETHYVSPTRLGIALVHPAVRAALAASPDAALPLTVLVDRPRLVAYSARLAREYSRPARDSKVRLRGLRPIISKARAGFKVPARSLATALATALRAGDRERIDVEHTLLRPRLTRANFGPVIVISRSANKLYLYRGARRWKTLGVATGQPAYPSPAGQFTIVTKQLNPWWYPPDSDWAAGLSPVPPGPGNPLGTRWMGLSVSGVGIHGTPDAASIGYSASHGCIRMQIPDAEWLFEHVSVGTTVFIV